MLGTNIKNVLQLYYVNPTLSAEELYPRVPDLDLNTKHVQM